jgi:hypothetical protein
MLTRRSDGHRSRRERRHLSAGDFHLGAGDRPVTAGDRSLDLKIANRCNGAVSPVRHPDKLTLEPLTAAIGVAAP